MNVRSLLWIAVTVVSVASCGGGGGASTRSSSVSASQTAPAAVFAVADAGQATISWSAVDGASRYNLHWGISPDVLSSGTEIQNVTSPYIQTGLADGTTYYYRVGVVTQTGEVLSDEVFALSYPNGSPTTTFTANSGNMDQGRAFHTATLLPTGKVLVGGCK